MQFHHHACNALLHYWNVEQLQSDRLAWPKDVSLGQREEQRICDLACCTCIPNAQVGRVGRAMFRVSKFEKGRRTCRG